MKATYYICLLTMLFVLSNCRKQDEPENTADAPYFGVTGTIDNEPVKFAAGEGFYMEPDFSTDSIGIISFIGNLKKDCAGCKTSLKITIRNSQIGSLQPDTSAIVYPNNYKFLGQSTSKYCRATFSSTGTGNGSGVHKWNFSDGTSYTGNPITKLFPIPSNDSIYLLSDFANCKSSLEGLLSFRDHIPATALDFTVSPLDSEESSFRFTANGYDLQSGYFKWDFGDGTTDYGLSPDHIYTDSLQPTLRTVSLTQYKTTVNDSNTVSRNIAVRRYNSCIANFNVVRDNIEDPYNFSAVVVEWTDELGITYSSVNAEQDAGSSFKVTGSSKYIADKRGRKTIAIDLLINCKVSDGSRTIELKNVSGRMAVAYP